MSEEEVSETLVDVLRRYIYYIEEQNIELDIQREENINQFHLLNNYSSSMTEILKSVSMSDQYFWDSSPKIIKSDLKFQSDYQFMSL